MTQVFIDPTKTTIAIQVLSQSLHAIGFNITVFQSDGNTVKEEHSGTTQNNNPETISLNNAPSNYKGCFISGFFTIVSPNGNDGPYALVFLVLVDGAVINPTMPLSGNTNGGKAITGGTFQLN